MGCSMLCIAFRLTSGVVVVQNVNVRTLNSTWAQGKAQKEDEELSKSAGKLLQKLYEKQNETQLPLVKELLKVQGAAAADA